MANLNDKYVKDTFHSILVVGTSGTSGVSGTPQKVTDGDGNETPLSLSSSQVGVSSLNVDAYGKVIDSTGRWIGNGAIAVANNYANDIAAKAAGLKVGDLYHTNGVVKVVIS